MIVPTGPEPRSDSELVAAHVAGDRRAFDELVRRHTDRLWRFAVRTVGDRQDAADALQEAFVSAFRAAPTWRGDATVATWLHRIVLHACLDRLRRRRVHRTEWLGPENDRPMARDPVADRMTVLDVDAALGELPPKLRAAVVLVDMEGMSVIEAAGVLEVPVGTVKSRAARARYRLAVLLGHLAPGADGTGGAGEGNRSGPGSVQGAGGEPSTRVPRRARAREQAEGG